MRSCWAGQRRWWGPAYGAERFPLHCFWPLFRRAPNGPLHFRSFPCSSPLVSGVTENSSCVSLLLSAPLAGRARFHCTRGARFARRPSWTCVSLCFVPPSPCVCPIENVSFYLHRWMRVARWGRLIARVSRCSVAFVLFTECKPFDHVFCTRTATDSLRMAQPVLCAAVGPGSGRGGAPPGGRG